MSSAMYHATERDSACRVALVMQAVVPSRRCRARTIRTSSHPLTRQNTFDHFPRRRSRTPSPIGAGGLDASIVGAGSSHMMQGEDLYPPGGDFWQLALPDADQVPIGPDPADAVVPHMRRFGSTGGAPVYSKLERQQRDVQARLEREALDQIISEVVVHMASVEWGTRTDMRKGYFHLSPGDMQRNLARCAAYSAHSKQVEKPIGFSCNISQRSTKDQTVSSGPAFEYACRTWRGKIVSDKDLPQYLFEHIGTEYAPNPYGSGYLVGNPAAKPQGPAWPYRPQDYPWGEGWEMEEEVGNMEGAVNQAQFYRRKVFDTLQRHETFKKMHDGNWNEFRAESPDEVQRKLTDEINGVGNMFHDQAEDLRGWVMRRYENSMKAKRIAGAIQDMCTNAVEARKSEVVDGSSLLLSVITTVDLLKPVIDDMKPTEASRLYTVLKGARVQDDDMFKLLLTRLPRLHIYTIPDMLPHSRRANGVGILYRDKQVKVPIGLVTSRMRSRIRYENPHINPVGVAEMIEEQHYGTERDPAYRKDEGKVILLDGDRTDRTNFTSRRVKNNGWNAVNHDLDDEHQLSLVYYGQYFREPPVVTCELVHAETRESVAPYDKWGGLEPERWLKTINGKMRYEPTPGPPSRHIGSSNPNRNPWVRPHGAGDEFDCPEGGILGRYNITCLTSEHEGAHFRIKVTMTGLGKAAGAETVTLTAETAPMVFVSNKRASEVKGVKKRKHGEK